ncbi:PHP domain-containing protein [Neobacillus niacini]|uniref:PHP domain-containing protein n=1 Tax=Neobacillus niacini TaxID=86668 RepID=UPI0028577CFD|nr:PHP domain-containing protein [Neobacillus niacini]MDR7001031.1 putative metal-dependent phosphoesterase TrpH [Neobacillus niacini]
MDLTNIVERGRFDLHLHTTASDGIYSPRELVKKASQAGLITIAITDHDTLDGVEEAINAGREFGIDVISSVEITTKYKGKTVDILGYGIKMDAELRNVLTRMVEERKTRAIRIIEKFTDLGMGITFEDVKKYSKGNVIARPHIARAIVEKGYLSNLQEVFDHYLADGKPCDVEKLILSPNKGIDLIQNAKGKAVLAHPKLIMDDKLVQELVKLPFDGIEVWHRKHNTEDVKKYRQIAMENGLIMTGGSDFHKDEDNLGQFGFEL